MIEVYKLIIRGVRLDVYFKDNMDTIYDMEMQVENRGNIPKRSRHYQGMIDIKVLPKGESDYDKLPDSVIIFICLFDLFGEGRYCYSFEYRCIESSSLALGDGTKKIYLNTKGTNDSEVSKELIEFLKFVENTKEIKLNCESVKKIADRVKTVKSNMEVEARYMTTLYWENDLLERGREEGREQGISNTIALLKDLGVADEEIIERVSDRYKMSRDKVKGYIL